MMTTLKQKMTTGCLSVALVLSFCLASDSFEERSSKTILDNGLTVLVKEDHSSPIVAMLSNHRNKNGWIEEMLTVGKIKGTASMDMQQQQIIFPHAFAGSDKIDIGAKGVITEHSRDGVIFARYQKLKGLLKIHDGKRSFDVIKAQQKFDDYSPEALIK